MKIRQGFVSNSSSSSFLIIGIENDYLLKEITEKAGLTKENYYGDGEYKDDNDIIFVGAIINTYTKKIEDFEYIGIEAKQLLKQGKTFDEVKKDFIKKIKTNYGIDIPEKEIDILYGEIER